MSIKLFVTIFPIVTADGTCEGVTCDSNAECIRELPERRRQCVCKDGWQGDGRACSGRFWFENHPTITKLKLIYKMAFLLKWFAKPFLSSYSFPNSFGAAD